MVRPADLSLKALGQFIGSQQYYDVFGFNVTDGVKYVMDNGYSWLVTDALAVIRYRPEWWKSGGFLTVELKLSEDSEADMIITDGNGNTLYSQHYSFTDAQRNLKLWFRHGVLYLPSEH